MFKGLIAAAVAVPMIVSAAGLARCTPDQPTHGEHPQSFHGKPQDCFPSRRPTATDVRTTEQVALRDRPNGKVKFVIKAGETVEIFGIHVEPGWDEVGCWRKGGKYDGSRTGSVKSTALSESY